MEKFKISDEYDGKTRKLFAKNCLQCQSEYWRPLKDFEGAKFCSKDCKLVFSQKNGKRIELNCTQCNKVFKKWQHHANKINSGRYFCGRKCQTEYFTIHKGNCKNCDVALIGKAKVYCSHKCHWIVANANNIQKWKSGEISGMNIAEGINSWVRKYIFEKYDNKCSLCSWSQINPVTKKIPLQIDHIDGNYKNNVEENLRLLCPNCHSLTPTFGFLRAEKNVN